MPLFQIRSVKLFTVALRHLLIATAITMPARAVDVAQVEDTKFSNDRGFYSEPVSVEISTKTRGAVIFYTLDGSAPTATHGIRYQATVPIFSTTVLRAAAFKDGMKSTNVDTMTYIFPQQVLKQSGEGLPKTWGMRNETPVVADYEMDPEITDSPIYRDRLLQGLESLPAVSIVLSQSDWLDPRQGLYANPTERGAAWERPASAEMIFPRRAIDRLQVKEKNFQIDCGLRVQG
ncbi:MAG: chitobiase/beta-hexosaminidase C-terminal domain-containing protein, partial [Aeoliella sp.]